GRLDRNFLLGHAGDAINALLVAAAHNLRLVLTVLALWFVWFLQASQPKTAKPHTSKRLSGCVASTA
ncbi:IS5/IS1182 family transposase, partial [Aurantimonas sp. A2-1-M11]